MGKAKWITVFLCAWVACSSFVFGEEAVEAAIRQRVGEYQSAYNRGDAKAVAAIYTEDGSHTYALGFTHRGRVEIAAGLEQMFAGAMKGTQIVLTPTKIRAVTTEVAVEEATFEMTGFKTPEGAEVGPLKGLCLAVYKKQGAEWFAVAVQCMMPPPAGERK